MEVDVNFWNEGPLVQIMCLLAVLTMMVCAVFYGRYLRSQLYSIRRSRYKVVERSLANVFIGVLGVVLISRMSSMLLDVNIYTSIIISSIVFIISYLSANRIKV